MKTLFLFLMLIALSIVTFTVWWMNNKKAPNVALQQVKQAPAQTERQKNNPQPSRTPFPFEEMTIPFLRAMQYQSKLGERTLYQRNGTYTSYITNYISDGLKINALLTIPTSEKPASGYPAIVFVHGYIPPSEYRTTEKYVDYVDNFAGQGYVVL